ncbi:LOW QUALITY PROTEIN: uncharacterized protein LJ206_002329 [Theristicus caerulescens]
MVTLVVMVSLPATVTPVVTVSITARAAGGQGAAAGDGAAGAAAAPPPLAAPAEALQVDLLLVLAAPPDTAPVAAATTTVDAAALKPPAPESAPPPVPPMLLVPPPSSEAPRKSKSKGPYICSLCAKELKNGYNLRRHKAIHTGAKAARPGPAAMKMPTVVPLSLLSVSGLGGGGGGHAQAGAEDPRLRDVREGVSRRLPPHPAQAVALGREALPVPRLPAALQAQGPDELPRPLPRRRRPQALHLQPLREELLQAQPPQQPRAPGPLHGATLQVGGAGEPCPMAAPAPPAPAVAVLPMEAAPVVSPSQPCDAGGPGGTSGSGATGHHAHTGGPGGPGGLGGPGGHGDAGGHGVAASDGDTGGHGEAGAPGDTGSRGAAGGRSITARAAGGQGAAASDGAAGAAAAPPPLAAPAEALQVDLLPVLAAPLDTAPVAAATTTVDAAALKPPAPESAPPPVPPMLLVPPPSSEAPRKSKSKGPYICSLCAKEFKNGYNLRRHEAIHTGAKAARPGPAAMKMPTMVPLSLLSVSGLGSGGGGATPKRARKTHACEMCGKAFRDVYHLTRHKLSHSDEKPYQCPVCQQRFKRKDRMSYHVRSHDGAVHKPYICSHCGKSFSRPNHLNSHVRQVHSTERPFKWEVGPCPIAGVGGQPHRARSPAP